MNTSYNSVSRLAPLAVAVAVMCTLSAPAALAADAANGTVAFKTFSSAVKYAYLVRSPHEFSPGQIVLRIYLSSADIGAKIKACQTLTCADGALADGAMVDFGAAAHLDYALRLNGERTQYSGATNADAFALSTNKSDHLAGKLHIDDVAAGGGKVDADFDLTVMSTFKSAR